MGAGAMAGDEAYVLVLRPRGQRPQYFVDRDEYNQYMVRASPDIRMALVCHNRGIAEGLRDDLRKCGYPGYEVMRVFEIDGRAVAPPGARGG